MGTMVPRTGVTQTCYHRKMISWLFECECDWVSADMWTWKTCDEAPITCTIKDIITRMSPCPHNTSSQRPKKAGVNTNQRFTVIVSSRRMRRRRRGRICCTGNGSFILLSSGLRPGNWPTMISKWGNLLNYTQTCSNLSALSEGTRWFEALREKNLSKVRIDLKNRSKAASPHSSMLHSVTCWNHK